MGLGGVVLGAGAVALMKRHVASKEQWLRRRGGGDHFDVVQSRISASRISTTPEGAGLKTPMVPRVSMMSEEMPDKMAGLMASKLHNRPKR